MGKASRSRRRGAHGTPGAAGAPSSARQASARQGRTARPFGGASAASAEDAPDATTNHGLPADEQARVVLRDLLGQAFAAIDRADAHSLDDVVAGVAAMCASPSTHRVAVLSLLDAMTRAATHAWELGWQPADIHRIVGRRLGPPEQQIAVHVMTDELGQYAPATIDRLWVAQLRELGGGSPRPRSVTWMDALRAAGTDWFTLVSRSVTVLHLLARLPRLEVLTPLPGQALPEAGTSQTGGADPATPADERILSRVRMLLAKAESTTFEAEAETFTAGAQALMARHSIDAALLSRDSRDGHGGTGPQGRRIGVDNPYEGPKAVLLQAVASANRCRMVWSRELGFATVVGFEADLEAVELLFTSLLVQATRTLAAAGSRSDQHGGSRTRSFRQSFLSAFADRIGERLHEATAHEEEAAVAESTHGRELVPLLAARAEEVDEQLDSWFPEVRQARVSAARDAEGWHHGRSAADRAHLGTARGVQA